MSNNNSKKRRHAPPAAPDAVFRIVCPAAKTADVAATSGDGAKILVEDLVGPEERVVVVVGDESAAQVALIRVLERAVDEETKNSTVSCKLVAAIRLDVFSAVVARSSKRSGKTLGPTLSFAQRPTSSSRRRIHSDNWKLWLSKESGYICFSLSSLEQFWCL